MAVSDYYWLNTQGQDGESMVENELQDSVAREELCLAVIMFTVMVVVSYTMSTYWLVWGSRKLAPPMFKHRLYYTSCV